MLSELSLTKQGKLNFMNFKKNKSPTQTMGNKVEK